MDFNVVWKSILIIVFGILLIRFSGRRSISQMTISQTVIMISIGTLLIQPVSEKNLWVTFVIAGILIGTLQVIEYMQMKWDVTETFFTGRSQLVIENGVLHEKNLKKMKLTVDKLEMRLRQNGIERIEDVQWATIEPSGQLGYTLKEHKKFATKEDIDQLRAMLDVLLRDRIGKEYVAQHQDQLNEQATLFSEIEQGHHQNEPDHLK
ncbi:DUF421 domain-containing protein [Sporosarcina saromensis]|uniref:DUF421 domain-containing protein n=1 Tax=Sporosarcina saromensis TaxID=359365 RepID=A0ABU4GDU2_9BACL|nr:DUF421 domain-containing protein [Sporosarcina saromensis]MDW0115122.1 DUF421 domain-containing protein [Sporosarcina saromensis]